MRNNRIDEALYGRKYTSFNRATRLRVANQFESNCGCSEGKEITVSIHKIDSSELKMVKEWSDSNLKSIAKYNFDRLLKVTVQGNVMYYANQMHNGVIKSAVCITLGEKGLVKGAIQGQLKIEGSEGGRLDLFNYLGNFQLKVLLNYRVGSVLVDNQEHSSASIFGDWGQDTLDCVGDAYTQHGGASIGLGIASLIEPWGLPMVMSACAGKNNPYF